MCVKTLFISENEFERGCTLNRRRKLYENDENVEICKESGCNRSNKLYSNCVHCDSKTNNACYQLSDPKNLTKQCKGTYTYSKRGCYTLKLSMYNVF